MEDFKKKLSLDEQMEEDQRTDTTDSSDSSNTLSLLRKFLEIQQRRAEAYAKLKRYH